MKKLLAFAVGTALSAGAFAAPAMSLPPGPVYIKFSGQEQIAVGGAHTYSDGKEINWGVIIVSTLEDGTVGKPNDQIDTTNDIIFANGFNGGQITGMFYGIEQGAPSAANPFPATNGYLDLYWRDLSKMSSSTTSGITPTDANGSAAGSPALRCGYDCAVGFTEGTFLARIKFDTGMDLGNPTNTIVGDTVPTTGPNGFSGFADSYGSIVADATVNGQKGLWANQLNSDWFNTYLGQRDLRFKNSYNANTNWNGGPGILGARIADPGQAFALPEPGALSLMGLAMVGMGAALRRREKKAAK
jgi:hypothetical protein